MKIKVEIDPNLEEEEITIRCREFSDEIAQVQKAITQTTTKKQRFEFCKGEKEFFFSMDDILFFETEENGICAHTVNDVFKVKYRLYELENMLPRWFVRVSKSTILNINLIFSMDWNITSSSIVTFQHTHKQVYVSRRYYKNLKNCLEEKQI